MWMCVRGCFLFNTASVLLIKVFVNHYTGVKGCLPLNSGHLQGYISTTDTGIKSFRKMLKKLLMFQKDNMPNCLLIVY